MSVRHVAPGVPFDVICTMKIPPGWHVYWEDSGASGVPTLIELESTPDFVRSATRYPRPTRLHLPEGTVNAMEGEITLVVPVTPSSRLEPGSQRTLQFDIEWFICKEHCFIGGTNLAVPISVGEVAGPPTTVADKAQLIPQPIASRPGTKVRIRDKFLEISGPIDVAGRPGFLPVRSLCATFGNPNTTRDETMFHMRIPIDYDQPDSGVATCRIRGLLTFGVNQTDPAWMIDLPYQVSTGELDLELEKSK